MKQVIKLLSILFLGITLLFLSQINQKSATARNLVLENVEALAQREGVLYQCSGVGALECGFLKVIIKINL